MDLFYGNMSLEREIIATEVCFMGILVKALDDRNYQIKLFTADHEGGNYFHFFDLDCFFLRIHPHQRM